VLRRFKITYYISHTILIPEIIYFNSYVKEHDTCTSESLSTATL
jgi:hypothetical protein